MCVVFCILFLHFGRIGIIYNHLIHVFDASINIHISLPFMFYGEIVSRTLHSMYRIQIGTKTEFFSCCNFFACCCYIFFWRHDWKISYCSSVVVLLITKSEIIVLFLLNSPSFSVFVLTASLRVSFNSFHSFFLSLLGFARSPTEWHRLERKKMIF